MTKKKPQTTRPSPTLGYGTPIVAGILIGLAIGALYLAWQYARAAAPAGATLTVPAIAGATQAPPPEPTAAPLATVAMEGVAEWPRFQATDPSYSFSYPPAFLYLQSQVRNPERVNETLFYDPAAYDPATSLRFNGIGALLLNNPDRLGDAQSWLDAHTGDAVDSAKYDLRFDSYEIVETRAAADGRANYFISTDEQSAVQAHNIWIPLPESDYVVLIYFYNEVETLRPVALAMADSFQAP